MLEKASPESSFIATMVLFIPFIKQGQYFFFEFQWEIISSHNQIWLILTLFFPQTVHMFKRQ